MHRDHDFHIVPALRDKTLDIMLAGNPFALRALGRSRPQEGDAPVAEEQEAPFENLVADLELDTLFSAMADGDTFLFEAGKRAVLSSLLEPAPVLYRQEVLSDVLHNPDVVRRLYALSLQAIENERNPGSIFRRTDTPESKLRWGVGVLNLQLDVLKDLRQLADLEHQGFQSPGFRRFFAMVQEELDDGYLHTLQQHLQELKFEGGILESARLGTGDRGWDYVLHRVPPSTWRERFGLRPSEPSFGFDIPPRDEGSMKALARVRDMGLEDVADAVYQASNHVKDFFTTLRLELAFHLGGLNLHERLIRTGQPTCFPEPMSPGDRAFVSTNLYDASLALTLDAAVIGNDIDADDTSLIVITGANQGGKTTLLRGIGIAQLMMQAGMFVCAASMRTTIANGVFTHFTRGEDTSMQGGKLDEELHRMSRIADDISAGALLLSNESFSSTNEREGSEIGHHVLEAMLECGISVVLVTHMYELAQHLRSDVVTGALFLRGDPRADGRPSFLITPGEPLPSSHGIEAYNRVFRRAVGTEPAGTSTN